jgi:hypothetical protein
MRDRISPYEQSADKINETLFYEENVTDSEKDNALVALARIVGALQEDVKRLKEETEENPHYLKGAELEKAIQERIARE